MSSNDQFNILGSAKLNTPDGKNPPVSGSNPAESRATATGQLDSTGHGTEHQKPPKSAHDAMEDRLREEERLARWKRE